MTDLHSYKCSGSIMEPLSGNSMLHRQRLDIYEYRPPHQGGFGEVSRPHYGRLGPFLLHFLYPCLPMGNRSSSDLVANGNNIAGLLLLVAGASPCFGSHVVALKVWTWHSGSADTCTRRQCANLKVHFSHFCVWNATIFRHANFLFTELIFSRLSSTSRL